MIGKIHSRHHFIVTGGAGFIGSHMVDFLLQTYPAALVTCLDRLTYASQYLVQNLAKAQEYENFRFVKTDLAENLETLQSILLCDLEHFGTVTILNFAAESSVDHSFLDPLFFTKNNILATQNVLEAVRLLIKQKPSLASKFSIVQISTDEVYGEQSMGVCADENSRLEPSNPYAASKAACDLIIGSYVKSYNLNVNTVRANNIYGLRQFPEKLIACTLNLLPYADLECGLSPQNLITIHGNGEHRRRYLHVKDFVRAVDIVENNARKIGTFGMTYNIGTEEEWSNKDLVEMICGLYMKIVHLCEITDFSAFYRFGRDRLYNDVRYSINTQRISELGWQQQIGLKEGITEMIMQTAQRNTKHGET